MIDNRLSSIQNTMLRVNNETKGLIDNLSDQIKSFNEELLRINNELNRTNKNIDKAAKRSELKELENMISIFDPLKSRFVTRNEEERIIGEYLKER